MRAICCLALALTLTSAAEAQTRAPQPLPPPASSRQAPPPSEPERRIPDQRHQSRLDQLFERLAASGSEAEAESLSEQIGRVWARSGSDTLDLLMDRVQQASRGQDPDTALDLLDSVLALKPDWAEAYNRRAAIHFQRRDMDGAMRDLRQALSLEPRHYQALAGVGMIFQQGGDEKRALAAFREALKLNPYLKGVRQAAERLALEHDGQGI